MKRYKLICEPITPVHIGTGRELDPLHYVIKDDRFLRTSPELFYKSLSEDKKNTFMDLIEEDNFLQIRQFVAEHLPSEAVIYSANVSPMVLKTYRAKLDNINNQLLIGEMIRNLRTSAPIIPGSSLKGAIRTAIVSGIASELSIDTNRRGWIPNFEKNVLKYKDAKSDPFRAIQITDCEIFGNNTNSVSEFYNFKENRRGGDDLAQMQMIKEHITGSISGGDSQGEAVLTIHEELFTFRNSLGRWEPLGVEIDIEFIMEHVFDFYMNNFKKEYDKFYKNSRNKDIKTQADKIMGILEEIEQHSEQLLLRVGRFSQVENVTVEKYRQPDKRVYGTTRNLSEEYLPAGLIKITVSELE
ncbi:MAG: type III-A CRISPR-associated RAMP protein Csm5 [Calditrichia bacterium]